MFLRRTHVKYLVQLDYFGLLYNFNIIFPKARYKIKTVKLPMKIPLELLKNLFYRSSQKQI
ncbi:hypothetical protein FF021_14000 [Leptospira noguchii]|nr:hypothetical protein FF021_14000 [Leptospira noguchii]